MRSTITNTEEYNDYEPAIEREGIDWDEVETKVSILVRKFNNIDARYRDDLAQELRLHALLKSDDFYDLQRRAIDFWRSMQRKVYPEIPFMDLELVGGSFRDKAEETTEFNDLLEKIRGELTREGSVSQVRLDSISSSILDIVLEDIRDGKAELDGELNRYINERINCTYLAKRLPEVHYKMIRKAVKNLEEVVGGLTMMRDGHSRLEF